ncbi:MAG: MoaD/ThiS family protein [Acidobacteriaceae bacterium]
MSVRVLLPNAFQKHTNGTREIRSEAGNLPQLITEIETQFPALKAHLRDEQGQVRRFINFYVNEEDIRFLGNEKYSFQDGDEVLVIPSIAGGSCAAECSAHGGTRAARGLCGCCSYCGQEECICGA